MNKEFSDIELLNFIHESGAKCVSCNQKLSRAKLESYDHTDGQYREGYRNKQWIYFTCIYCGYGNALWKLVKRWNRLKKLKGLIRK